MKKYDIHGSGGKGGGSKETRTPIEDPNNLQSRAIARFIDLLGEGEILGLVDGERSIYFNQIPITDNAGNRTVSGITELRFKPGDPEHSVLQNFPTTESEVVIGGGSGVEMSFENQAPAVAITNTNVDKLRFSFTIPSLSTVDIATGDILKTTVSWKIQIQPSGGNYVDVKTITKT